MAKNYTGILNYLLVYDYGKGEFDRPVGYGYTVCYHIKDGSIRCNHTLYANDDSPLREGMWNIKAISADVLVVVNRTIQ